MKKEIIVEKEKSLLLYLEAPLQSWGYQSRFDRRTTLSYPTKSGVLGMLSAALGQTKKQKHELGKLKNLIMHIYVVSNPARLEDFQTIGGGYDKKTQKRNIPQRASGKVGSTIISRREYLMDAKFAVTLNGCSSLIGKIAKALKNPQWGIWLGRKCCIPTYPIMQGVYENEKAGLKDFLSQRDLKVLKTIKEVNTFENGTDTLKDIPLDFEERKFVSRRVSEE